METIEYDSTTGKKLKQGEKTTDVFGNTYTQGQAFSPTTISVDTLQKNPTPLTLPTQTDLSFNPINLTPLQTEMDKINKQKEKETSDITNLMKSIGIIEGKQGEYFESQGGDIAKEDYDRYQMDLIAEQKAIRDQLEKVRTTFSGNVAGMREEQSRLERQSLSKQADLAISAEIAGRRYDRALNIAQRKVDNELKPLQMELEAKKFIYDNNKELFSTAQLSKLNSLIKADERKLEDERVSKLKGEEMIINAIQSKAPQNLITKAKQLLADGKGYTEVASVLGNYSLSQAERLENEIKQAQLNKLNEKAEEYTLSTSGNPLKEEDKNKIETFSDIARLAEELKTMSGQKAAVGKSFLLGYVPGTKAFGFKEKTEQLVNTLASGNLDKLKGAMSDKDILFLQKINTNLSTKLSEKDYNKELNRIYNTITNKLKNDYGIDYKVNMSDLSNDELINVASENIDNATFFNNL